VRVGAAIIVVIGVVAASLILFERGVGPRLRHLDDVIHARLRGGGYTDLEKIAADRDTLARARCVLWFLHVAAIVLLGCWFIRLSRTAPPKRYRYSTLPHGDDVMLLRLARPHPPFQYGIISLLALTLAVAIACSAALYPLK
jgi:hypothetical protein